MASVQARPGAGQPLATWNSLAQGRPSGSPWAGACGLARFMLSPQNWAPFFLEKGRAGRVTSLRREAGPGLWEGRVSRELVSAGRQEVLPRV